MLESEIYKLLIEYGFKVPKFYRSKLEDTPHIDFFPIALKIESKKIVHKSDFGAVKINISNEEELIKAKVKIINSIEEKGIKLDSSDYFLISQMIDGYEFFVGVVDDDIFGKIIVFGEGGVFLELHKDVCYIDLYAHSKEIKKSIESLKIAKLFKGFRGHKFDIEEVVEFIKRVQSFVIKNPTIKEMDFNPVMFNSDGLTIVDSRIKFNKERVEPLVRSNRHNFFENQNIAIVGASSTHTKVGYAIAKNSLDSSCNPFFVNGKGGKLFDRDVYSSISEIEEDIDTAVITIPSKFIFDTVEELIKKGLKNLIIISAGFKEIGDIKSENRLKEMAWKHNFNIIGPNCLGYYNSITNLNLTFGASPIHAGEIAIISQSGAILSSLMDKAYKFGIGFSHIVSAGNMVDINFGELIEMLNKEESCKYICIYAEGITDGKRFLNALRETKKPIYIFKTGKSELSKKVAFSHTGNLSGNYKMFKSLIESVGSKIEDNIEALLFNPIIECDNILVITNAGGPASILSDYIIDKGKKLYQLKPKELKALDEVLPFNWPRANPIDIIGDAMSDRYENSLKIAQEFRDVELIYLIVTPQFMTDSLNIAKLLTRKWDKKIIPIFLGGESFRESMEYLYKNNIIYFDCLQDATSFL